MDQHHHISEEPADGPATNKQSHFITCPGCGARLDARDLGAFREHVHGAAVPFRWHHERQTSDP